MENTQLSPRAMSKEIHKVAAWITPSIKDELNKKLHQNKMDKSDFNTKSKIIADCIEKLYFSPDALISFKELMACRITFYLTKEQIQILWDIEGHYLGEGKKRITTSRIITSSLINFL